MEELRHAGVLALLTLTIDLVPLVMAIAYVIRPTDHRLALMRPISLAGLFSALAAPSIGFINVLRGIGMAQQLSFDGYRRVALGAAESMVPMFVGFAALTGAWLLVAAGMARTGR